MKREGMQTQIAETREKEKEGNKRRTKGDHSEIPQTKQKIIRQLIMWGPTETKPFFFSPHPPLKFVM